MKPNDEQIKALAKLRVPFPKNQIKKLPKPTKVQTEEVRKDYRKGIRCEVCGGWHHPKVIHLDYVGHAAITDRLLEVDPFWDWEPMSTDEHGLPLIIGGGMWIKLTVCGVTRKGYGDAQDKTGHNAIKEAIGDALRNAGMRFGMALDLWHGGDLHIDDSKPETNADAPKNPKEPLDRMIDGIEFFANKDLDSYLNWYQEKVAPHISFFSKDHQDRIKKSHNDMEKRLMSKVAS